MRFEKIQQKTKKLEQMSVIVNYFILCGFMFGVVTALYLGFKTIKLI